MSLPPPLSLIPPCSALLALLAVAALAPSSDAQLLAAPYAYPAYSAAVYSPYAYAGYAAAYPAYYAWGSNKGGQAPAAGGPAPSGGRLTNNQ